MISTYIHENNLHIFDIQKIDEFFKILKRKLQCKHYKEKTIKIENELLSFTPELCKRSIILS